MNIFGYDFGIIDLSIIGITLLFVIVGLARGFLKQILSIANGLVSIVVSCCIVKPVTQILSKTALSDKINVKILDMIVSKYPNSATIETSLITTKEELSEAFTTSGLPSPLSKIASEFIKIDSFSDGEFLSEAIAKSLGYLVLSIITFVVLFIVILIIIKILISVLDSLTKGGVLNVINRILGLALGLVKACVFICVCLFVISVLVKYIEPLNNFITNDLKLEVEGFGIGKYLYENNPLIIVWNLIFNKA